jgi:hypothetical protein
VSNGRGSSRWGKHRTLAFGQSLVGALGNGTALLVVGIMAGFAVLAAIFLTTAHRTRSESSGDNT